MNCARVAFTVSRTSMNALRAQCCSRAQVNGGVNAVRAQSTPDAYSVFRVSPLPVFPYMYSVFRSLDFQPSQPLHPQHLDVPRCAPKSQIMEIVDQKKTLHQWIELDERSPK
eukprot:4164094-Prymnesium_polylepis.1